MNKTSLRLRAIMFLSIFFTWGLLRFFLMMKIRKIGFHFFPIKSANVKVLFNHFLIILESIILYLLYLTFKRFGLIEPIQFTAKKKYFSLGILVGIGIFFSTFPIVFHYQMKTYPQFSIVDIIGNIFSNGAEELIYRGVLYAAALSFFSSPIIAIILSSIAFGVGHWDMPYLFQAYIAMVGIALGVLRYKTKNLTTSYISHMTADLLCDCFFH